MFKTDRRGAAMPILTFALCVTLSIPAHAVPTAAPVVAAPLTLDAAVAYALAHNPDLRGSDADTKAAVAGEYAAASAQRLRVSETTYGTTGSMGSIVMSAPDVAPQSLIAVPSKGFVDQNVTATIPLSNGGRVKALKLSARGATQAAIGARDAMAHHLGADIAAAYVDAILAADLQTVAQARVDSETEQVRVIGEKVTNGKLAPVDLLREQAELADATQALTTAQTRVQLALSLLKTAMGADQTTPYALTDTLDTLSARWPAPATTLGQAIVAAQSQRVESKVADANIAAARAQITAAKSLYSPQVVGFGMVDINSPIDRGASASAGYTVGVAASLPLSDGGERSANTRAAEAKLERADADAASIRNKIAGEVADAWLRLAPASAQVLSTEAGLDAAQKAYDLAVMRYEAGKAIAAERLDSLFALTRARGALREAIADQIKARLALVRAAGAEMTGTAH